MRLIGDMVLEHLHQATLANPSFTAQEHDLPMSCLGLLPTLYEQSYFLLPTDQWCQSPGCSHIETPPGSTFLEDSIHVDGLSHTSERLCPQVLTLEIALDQSIGHFTHRYRVGCCQSFDARTNVGHVTQCQLFLSSCATHIPNNDQPRMNP